MPASMKSKKREKKNLRTQDESNSETVKSTQYSQFFMCKSTLLLYRKSLKMKALHAYFSVCVAILPWNSISHSDLAAVRLASLQTKKSPLFFRHKIFLTRFWLEDFHHVLPVYFLFSSLCSDQKNKNDVEHRLQNIDTMGNKIIRRIAKRSLFFQCHIFNMKLMRYILTSTFFC